VVRDLQSGELRSEVDSKLFMLKMVSGPQKEKD
jgi:hypothetical protein